MLADAARRHGALLAVNDRADIARAAGADVLHLGQDDLPLTSPATSSAPGTLIGRSTHDAEQARAALTEDVDYFCVGPCWPTPTKPGRPAPGLDLVRTVSSMQASALTQPSRGSRSAALTCNDCPRYSTRARAGWWWCGRSPRPRIRSRQPAISARHLQQRGDAAQLEQPMPACRETGMQRQLGHLLLDYPPRFIALMVGHGVERGCDASATTVV